MHIIIYLLIFISKIIENALSTLRLIVVANGKKFIGAILQFCIALVWVLVTGVVVTNITKDPLKIIFFALGSFVGSLFGSILEEKIALGFNMITCTTVDGDLYNTLTRKGYKVVKLKGQVENTIKDILLITVPRKKMHNVINLINDYDKKALITSEITNFFDK